MIDPEDPSEYLVALFAAWWTCPDLPEEEQIRLLYEAKAKGEGFDPDELTEDLLTEAAESDDALSIDIEPPNEDDEDEGDE